MKLGFVRGLTNGMPVARDLCGGSSSSAVHVVFALATRSKELVDLGRICCRDGYKLLASLLGVLPRIPEKD
jgi:hypothetical protein